MSKQIEIIENSDREEFQSTVNAYLSNGYNLESTCVYPAGGPMGKASINQPPLLILDPMYVAILSYEK